MWQIFIGKVQSGAGSKTENLNSYLCDQNYKAQLEKIVSIHKVYMI